MQGQPAPQTPASDLHELLKEIKELKAGLLGDSVTHDNPTFEGPPWANQAALQCRRAAGVPVLGLHESVSPLLRGLPSLQARRPRPPTHGAALSAGPAKLAATSTPSTSASSAIRSKIGSRIAKAGAVVAATSSTARTPPTSSTIPSPALRSGSHTLPTNLPPPSPAFSTSTPSSTTTPLQPHAVTPAMPRSARQKPVAAVNALGAMATSSRNSPRTSGRTGLSAGPSPASSVVLAARSSTGSGSSNSSSALAAPGSTSARKRPPQGGVTDPAHSSMTPRRVVGASGSQTVHAGSSVKPISRSTATAGHGTVGKSSGRSSHSASASAHSGSTAPSPPMSPPPKRTLATAAAGMATAAMAAASAAAKRPAAAKPSPAAAVAVSPAAVATAESELDCEVSHPSLTLPTLTLGPDMLAGESLEDMLAGDPWLAASTQADAGGGPSPIGEPAHGVSPRPRPTSDELLRPLTAAMAIGTGNSDWLDGDTDAEMNALMQGAIVAFGGEDEAESDLLAAQMTAVATTAAAAGPTSATPVAMALQEHGGMGGGGFPAAIPSPRLRGILPGSTATELLAATTLRSSQEPVVSTVCKVRELLGIVGSSSQESPSLDSEELWRNITNDANNIFSEHGAGGLAGSTVKSTAAAVAAAVAMSRDASPLASPTASPSPRVEGGGALGAAALALLGPSSQHAFPARGPMPVPAAAAASVSDAVASGRRSLTAAELADVGGANQFDSLETDDGFLSDILAAEAVAAAAAVIAAGSPPAATMTATAAVLQAMEVRPSTESGDEPSAASRRLMYQASNASSFGYDATVAFEATLISRQLAGGAMSLPAHISGEDAIMEGDEASSAAATPQTATPPARATASMVPEPGMDIDVEEGDHNELVTRVSTALAATSDEKDKDTGSNLAMAPGDHLELNGSGVERTDLRLSPPLVMAAAAAGAGVPVLEAATAPAAAPPMPDVDMMVCDIPVTADAVADPAEVLLQEDDVQALEAAACATVAAVATSGPIDVEMPQVAAQLPPSDCPAAASEALQAAASPAGLRTSLEVVEPAPGGGMSVPRSPTAELAKCNILPELGAAVPTPVAVQTTSPAAGTTTVPVADSPPVDSSMGASPPHAAASTAGWSAVADTAVEAMEECTVAPEVQEADDGGGVAAAQPLPGGTTMGTAHAATVPSATACDEESEKDYSHVTMEAGVEETDPPDRTSTPKSPPTREEPQVEMTEEPTMMKACESHAAQRFQGPLPSKPDSGQRGVMGVAASTAAVSLEATGESIVGGDSISSGVAPLEGMAPLDASVAAAAARSAGSTSLGESPRAARSTLGADEEVLKDSAAHDGASPGSGVQTAGGIPTYGFHNDSATEPLSAGPAISTAAPGDTFVALKTGEVDPATTAAAEEALKHVADGGDDDDDDAAQEQMYDGTAGMDIDPGVSGGAMEEDADDGDLSEAAGTGEPEESTLPRESPLAAYAVRPVSSSASPGEARDELLDQSCRPTLSTVNSHQLGDVDYSYSLEEEETSDADKRSISGTGSDVMEELRHKAPAGAGVALLAAASGVVGAAAPAPALSAKHTTDGDGLAAAAAAAAGEGSAAEVCASGSASDGAAAGMGRKRARLVSPRSDVGELKIARNDTGAGSGSADFDDPVSGGCATAEEVVGTEFAADAQAGACVHEDGSETSEPQAIPTSPAGVDNQLDLPGDAEIRADAWTASAAAPTPRASVIITQTNDRLRVSIGVTDEAVLLTPLFIASRAASLAPSPRSPAAAKKPIVGMPTVPAVPEVSEVSGSSSGDQQPLLHAWQVLVPPSPISPDGEAGGRPASNGSLAARRSLRSMLSGSSRLSRVSSHQDEDGEAAAVVAAQATDATAAAADTLEPLAPVPAADTANSGGWQATQDSVMAECTSSSGSANAQLSEPAALGAATSDVVQAAASLSNGDGIGDSHSDVGVSSPPAAPEFGQPANGAKISPSVSARATTGSPMAVAALVASSDKQTVGSLAPGNEDDEEQLQPAWKLAAAAAAAAAAADETDAGGFSSAAARSSLGVRRSLRSMPLTSAGSRLKRSSSHSSFSASASLAEQLDTPAPAGDVGAEAAQGAVRPQLDEKACTDGSSAAAAAAPAADADAVATATKEAAPVATTTAAAAVVLAAEHGSGDEGALPPAWKVIAVPAVPAADTPDIVAAARCAPLGAQPSFRSSRAGSSRLRRASAPDADDFDFAADTLGRGYIVDSNEGIGSEGASQERSAGLNPESMADAAAAAAAGATAMAMARSGDDFAETGDVLELGGSRSRSCTFHGNDSASNAGGTALQPVASVSYSSDSWAAPRVLLRGSSMGRTGGLSVGGLARSLRRVGTIGGGGSPARVGVSENGSMSSSWAARTSSHRITSEAVGFVPLPRRSVGGGDPHVDALRPAWQVLPLPESPRSPCSKSTDEAGGGAGAAAPLAANMLASMRSSSRLSRMSSGIPEDLLAELRMQAYAAVGHLQGSPHGDDSAGGLADMEASMEDSAAHERLLLPGTTLSGGGGGGGGEAAADSPTAGNDGAAGMLHAWKVLPLRAPAPSATGMAGPEAHAACTRLASLSESFGSLRGSRLSRTSLAVEDYVDESYTNTPIAAGPADGDGGAGGASAAECHSADRIAPANAANQSAIAEAAAAAAAAVAAEAAVIVENADGESLAGPSTAAAAEPPLPASTSRSPSERSSAPAAIGGLPAEVLYAAEVRASAGGRRSSPGAHPIGDLTSEDGRAPLPESPIVRALNSRPSLRSSRSSSGSRLSRVGSARDGAATAAGSAASAATVAGSASAATAATLLLSDIHEDDNEGQTLQQSSGGHSGRPDAQSAEAVADARFTEQSPPAPPLQASPRGTSPSKEVPGVAGGVGGGLDSLGSKLLAMVAGVTHRAPRSSSVGSSRLSRMTSQVSEVGLENIVEEGAEAAAAVDGQPAAAVTAPAASGTAPAASAPAGEEGFEYNGSALGYDRVSSGRAPPPAPSAGAARIGSPASAGAITPLAGPHGVLRSAQHPGTSPVASATTTAAAAAGEPRGEDDAEAGALLPAWKVLVPTGGSLAAAGVRDADTLSGERTSPSAAPGSTRQPSLRSIGSSRLRRVTSGLDEPTAEAGGDPVALVAAAATAAAAGDGAASPAGDAVRHGSHHHTQTSPHADEHGNVLKANLPSTQIASPGLGSGGATVSPDQKLKPPSAVAAAAAAASTPSPQRPAGTRISEVEEASAGSSPARPPRSVAAASAVTPGRGELDPTATPRGVLGDGAQGAAADASPRLQSTELVQLGAGVGPGPGTDGETAASVGPQSPRALGRRNRAFLSCLVCFGGSKVTE
ncbi:hypothetical protein VOLCADRAFT_89936 [Volvox carteri f. nagariensis]|uniref:Uncharacterized protein n=1 Tax=Volvox carteri f. nagariensis TaxID=3068 RepID=D8TT20_VOLCA|nr:uncharacterized protein VOLCADRAFT_89936 [Volvox carteri f. nagariensis]EFJ49579.1 hypothetical protein VOLCADRAFT_89936 [Volvox carteri f. nagariensis]|eukprot:XP_002949560.1 hypothetical protein VOLCADRAFT_89936 [Volvox carteri f. nagariensis]